MGLSAKMAKHSVSIPAQVRYRSYCLIDKGTIHTDFAIA